MAVRLTNDLRSALELLAASPGHLLTRHEPVDPYCELASLFRRTGAGRAVLFERVKDSAMPVVTGVMATRDRMALLLGSSVERLAFDLMSWCERPLPPALVQNAPCQQVVERPPFDLRNRIPVITHTPDDGAAFITAGLIRACDPETGAADVTIHRLSVLGPDRLGVYFVPGRRIDGFRAKAEAAGAALPVSVSIGLDPAIHLAACASAREELDELSIAGGIRGREVKLVNCISVRAQAVASAEIVIEGEILPGVRAREDEPTDSGYSMPEFHGYVGTAQPDVPVMRVTALTHRRDPIFQTIISPGGERANLIGVSSEARILREAGRSLEGVIKNVYLHPSGGGSYLAVIQTAPRKCPQDDRPNRAAALALAECRELKQIFLVDEDVDPFDTADVLWALSTRHRGAEDTSFLPGPELRFLGAASRTILDCTVPFESQSRLRRAKFQA